LLAVPKYKVGSGDPLGVLFYLTIMDDGVAAPKFTVVRGGDAPTDGGRRRFGAALAVGRVSGDAATEDYVVASDKDVVVLEDGKEQPAVSVSDSSGCPDLALSTAFVDKEESFRALGVGDLLPNEPGEEIALGTPGLMNDGTVVIMGVKTVTGKPPVLHCLQKISAPMPSGKTAFGMSLAVADFLDAPGLELLVGSPPDRAYLYVAPFTGAPIEFKVPAGSNAGAFGTRVGAVNVDGLPGPEIIVAATDYSVGTTAGAGKVFAFSRDGETLLFGVNDNNPTSRGNFGLSIKELTFVTPEGCPNGPAGAGYPLLVVGSAKEVFTYYKLNAAALDPRCFR
jgi:hypothetical protein